MAGFRGGSRRARSLYLSAASLTLVIAAALIATCALVEQRRREAWEGGGSGDEGGWVELAGNGTNGTGSLAHDPDCAADDHCRGACRMVCSEIDWNIGAENHAATLLSFGCCRGAPIIMSPSGGQGAREMELAAAPFPTGRFLGAPRRGLLAAGAGGLLDDHHSLSADYAALLRDEKAMAKRVAKMPVSSVLRRVGTGDFDAFGGGSSGSSSQLKGRGGGGDVKYYFLPQLRQQTTRPHDKTASDPYGTERQAGKLAAHAFKWDGRECVGEDCPRDTQAGRDFRRFQHALQATTVTGGVASFMGGGNYSDEVRAESEIDPFGVPQEDTLGMGEPSRLWHEDAYLNYKWCLTNATKDECLNDLDKDSEGWEWRVRDQCRDRVGVDTRGTWGPVDGVHFNDSCIELVPSRVEAQYGHAVARGTVSVDDLEDELTGNVPTDEGVKHYLGDALYKDYMREKADNDFWGPMHVAVRQGQHRVRRAYAFRKAYNASEYQWCLRHHQAERSFPRACMEVQDFTGRPFQARFKPRTAPEEIFDGVLSGFADMLGGDKHEVVRKKGQYVVEHPNAFEYGAQAADPSRLEGRAAFWERVKGVRDEPQHVEQKARNAREMQKLPGVNIDSLTGAIPTMFERANQRPIAVTPHTCCAKYVDYSKWE